MSTTIYTGFKFKSSDLFTINKYLSEYRKEINDKTRERYYDLISHNTTSCYDNTVLGVSSIKKNKDGKYELYNGTSPLYSGLFIMEDKDMKELFEVSLIIYPVSKTKVLGTFHSRNNETEREFFAKPFVEEYGYWNNTDQPDGVTDKEWKQREKDWDKVFTGWAIPRYCGYNVEFINVNEFGWARDIQEQILNGMPSLEKRIERVVRLLMDKHYEISFQKEISECNNKVSKYIEFTKLEIYKKLKEKYVAKLKKVLPATLTKEMLATEYDNIKVAIVPNYIEESKAKIKIKHS
jgi:hypothetical protein